MEVQKDFADLFKLFNAAKIEYLIVGGYALAFHGAPRYTGDLDLFVNPDADNARRIVTALEAFGFGSVGLKPEDFTQPGNVVQLGYPPVRIDLITSLSGLSWDEVWVHRETGSYGGVPVAFIGRRQYVVNKRAAGRKKDLADLEALGEDRQAE